MMRKARVTNPGSSYLLPGSVIDKNELVKVNNELEQRKEAGEQIEPVECEAVLLLSLIHISLKYQICDTGAASSM